MGLKARGVLLGLLVLIAACAGGFAWSPLAAALCAPADGQPLFRHEIVRILPHDTGAYTQGLLISGDILFESTGLYGESTVRRLDLASGRELAREVLPARLFGEGLALAQGELFQLSWREGDVRIYHPESLRLRRTARIPGAGWGLAFDGRRLIQSDGSAFLFFRDLQGLAELDRVQIRAGTRPLSGLNELEYANGLVLANIYPTDCIAVIDPAAGQVVGWLDMSGLAGAVRQRAPGAEVTNGIAYNPATGTYYVTGKRWPEMFELRISGLAAPARPGADPQ
jgi:glutamine cyclotransferase